MRGINLKPQSEPEIRILLVFVSQRVEVSEDNKIHSADKWFTDLSLS